jgi:SNF2 family DNA or RNA helicase
VSIWQHQEDAIRWAMSRQAAILHHGMGAGKTRTALEYLRRIGAVRALVCCPKAVIAAWVKQVGLWMPGFRVVALDRGSSKDKEQALVAALADTSPVIVVCNYESVWRIKGVEKATWSALVWDEIHRLKSPSGVASRWASKMCKAHPNARRLGLTGTLIPHSVLDAWAIYRAVESPECTTFGTSFTIHKAHFAVLSNGQQRFVVGFKNLEVANRRIASTTHYVRTTDVIDLPPISYHDVPCSLSPAEARLYREVEKDFCAVCEAGVVTPKNALEQLLRMQQITGGFVRYDGDKVAKQIAEHPSKAAVLGDMLEDLPQDEPVVIFCRFTSDIQAATAAAKKAGREVSELSGHKNELADWQQGKTSVLVAQIQSGGIGIDLTRAAYCFFFSLGYSLAEYEQAVARLHRPGQEKKTTIYHLVATVNGQSTVDGRVYSALRERKEVVDELIRGYKPRHNTLSGTGRDR